MYPLEPVIVPGIPWVVGPAWFFEHTVIYGPASNVLTMARSRNFKKNHGEFIGVVIGKIPHDPQRILFQYHTTHEAFRKKQSFKRNLKKRGHGKKAMWETKRELAKYKDLGEYLE